MNDILGWRPPQRTPAVPRFFENILHYRQVHQFSLYGTCPSNRGEEQNGIKKKFKKDENVLFFFLEIVETLIFQLTFCFDAFSPTSNKYTTRKYERQDMQRFIFKVAGIS